MIPNTKYMSGLIETLVETGLGLSSAKLYVSKLAMLNDKKGYNNLDFLKKKSDIDDRINTSSENIHSRKSAYTAIVSVLNKAGGDKMKKLLDYYRAKLVEIVETVKAIPANTKTAKQDENWLPFEEVMEAYNKLEAKVKAQKPDSKNMTDINLFTDWVLLSMYVLQAPRRNLDNILVIGDAKTKANETVASNFYNPKTGLLTYRVYKTAKITGEEEFTANDALRTVLKTNIKKFGLVDGDNLLRTSTGDAIKTSSQISKKLNSIFKPLNISSSMLRHIYITHMFGDTLTKQQEVAKSMGHSVEMQKDYILKD